MYNELEQLKLVQSDVIEVKPYFAYGQLKLAYNSTDLQNALSIPKMVILCILQVVNL